MSLWCFLYSLPLGINRIFAKIKLSNAFEIKRKESEYMKKTHFNETTQRHGYLTGDIHYHDAGISSKTGNRYNAFAYFYYLPLNREQTVRIDVDVAFYDEILEATADMPQTQRIVIVGQEDASGHFLATEVRAYSE